MNVFRLLRLQKKVVVYTVPIKKFQELKTLRDWDEFLTHSGLGLRDKVEQRVTLEAPERRSPIQAVLSV